MTEAVPSQIVAEARVALTRLVVLTLALIVAPNASAATGGPDAFGYTWRDSREPGVTFAWEDISATGIELAGPDRDDATFGYRRFSFNMPWYGGVYSTVGVCSNGFAALGDAFFRSGVNLLLPDPGANPACIAVYWDDLDVTPTGSVQYQDFGDHVVIQWTDVVNEAFPAFRNTFQVVLRADGVVVVRYLRVDAPTTSCTVGIQNATATIGLTAYYNSPSGPPGADYSIEFHPPPPIPTSVACASATQLSCGDVVTADLSAGAANQSQYYCSPLNLDGREQVHRFDLPTDAVMHVALETISGAPQLLLLDACNVNVCFRSTAGSVSGLLHPGTWYAVVDCEAGSEGAYRINLDCASFPICDGQALVETAPTYNRRYRPRWLDDDGSWLVEGWLYHDEDADNHALRVDGATIYDDTGSAGCTRFPSLTKGLSDFAGPAFTEWSAPEGSLRLDLSPTDEGGCCGLLVDMTVTNTDSVPHFFDLRLFYDTAFGNERPTPGCDFSDAVDGGPIEVRGTTYLTEQDLLALGADTCAGQVRMYGANDPTRLRASWEMLGPNLPYDMEFIQWGDGAAPATQWSGFVEGVPIADCNGDTALLLIWRVPAGGGTLAPGESQHVMYRIGWACSFPCCESPVLGSASSQVTDCGNTITLSWDAATFPGAGGGAYHVYRSDVSFADATTRAPIAEDLAAASYVDATAIAGTDYWYVVQAESTGFPGCGTGPLVAGSTDEVEVGPVRADPDVTPPASVVGAALRATGSTDTTVDFDWLLAPPPGPDEHHVVHRSDDDPRGPFAVVGTPVAQTWTDPDAPPRFSPTHCWYYDVRVADDCGNESAD